MVHIVFSVDFYSVYLYSMSILFVVTLDIFSINVPIYIYQVFAHVLQPHVWLLMVDSSSPFVVSTTEICGMFCNISICTTGMSKTWT